MEASRVSFGGRVMIRTDGHACLYCMDQLDRAAVRRDLSSPDRREEEDKMYGVSRDALGETGPSVVSLNGIIASLAVTEFMVWKTGVLRLPKRHLRYDGVRGIVLEVRDPPQADCPYCT